LIEQDLLSDPGTRDLEITQSPSCQGLCIATWAFKASQGTAVPATASEPQVALQ
ncbi:unnamed protein product, partial [Cladocopium goreaui]